MSGFRRLFSGIFGGKKSPGSPASPRADLSALTPHPLPQDAPAWHSEGQRLAALRCWEEALTCYSHALDLDPTDTAAWIDKAISLALLGRREEAIACCDQAWTLTHSL